MALDVYTDNEGKLDIENMPNPTEKSNFSLVVSTIRDLYPDLGLTHKFFEIEAKLLGNAFCGERRELFGYDTRISSGLGALALYSMSGWIVPTVLILDAVYCVDKFCYKESVKNK